MCKIANTKVGIKKLDFIEHRGKMTVYLTDGRKVIVPLSLYPDIRRMRLDERAKWIILDDQFFTFESLSRVYSIAEIMSL